MTSPLPPDAVPLIVARALSRTFDGGVAALAPVELTLVRGEVVALVGPSGCGKSTLLRLLAGLDTPSTGSVIQREALRIGVVFQEPTLMPWAKVDANVRLPLDLLPTDRRPEPGAARARVATLLATVGLTEFAGAWPRELSGGMKMRASLARALVTEPDLLLLDEPFGALDDLTRMRLDDELLRVVRERQLGALMVTHNVTEAVFLADRVVVMSARPGRLLGTVAVPTRVRDLAFRTSAAAAAHAASVHALLARAGT